MSKAVERAGRAGSERTLGRLPTVVLLMSAGLVVVSLANAWALPDPLRLLPLWWVGLLLVWVPALWRLASAEPDPLERGLSLVALAVALFVVQLVVSPTELIEPDELSHLRTLADIAAGGRAFDHNPLLLISPLFPGLETGTLGLAGWAGLEVHVAGQLILLAGRVLLVVAAWQVLWAASGSPRVAALGAAIYCANPSFLFFDATWSYESLALPFAAGALWCTARWWRTGSRGAARGWGGAAIVLIMATTVTHHLTLLVMTAALVGWAAAAVLRPLPGRSARPVVLSAVAAVVSSAAWLATVAGTALDYLGEIVGGAITDLAGLLTSGSGGRVLFVSRGGLAPPTWETSIAWAGTGLLGILIALGALHALRAHRRDPLVLLLVGVAIAYPPTLVLRLTGAGAETSQRASEFLYLGVGFVVADLLVHLPRRLARPRLARPRTALVTAGLTVLVAAATVLGSVWFTRLRGPYRPAAEQLSVDAQGQWVAAWARDALGPRNRFVADRTHQKLLAGHGGQDTVTAFSAGVATAYAMWDPTITAEDLRLLRAGRVAYVLADTRISEATPVFPLYFEGAEPSAGQHMEPWPRAGLEKWDADPVVSRIVDTGDVRVYDVRGRVR